MDNKNLILAVVFSVAILFAFQFISERLYPKPAPLPPTAQTQTGTPTQAPPSAPGAPPASPTQAVTPPGAPGGGKIATPAAPAAVATAANRAQALQTSPRVRIETPSLHGSIALVGGRIDDVTLVNYRETIDPTSPEIVLFSPQGAPDAYFAEHGWVAPGGSVPVPGPTTRWTADNDTLTVEQPVTLRWDNGEGLVFTRTYAIDEHYMFTLRQSVESARSEAVSLLPYGLITR
ncbi:MAG TPA: membrane protein insertase YidC, partial [Rhodospirillales bacterium]|nr:membrane protein insertase YidC [Rhodospirillales bacterium]